MTSPVAVPLRIAVYHDLPSGGAKRALVEQVRGLRARGHTVDAFVPTTADEAFLPLAPHVRHLYRWPVPPPPNRERTLTGRWSLALALAWGRHFARVWRMERRLARDIDARAYDVVLVHPSQFTQAPWCLRTLRTPTVYYCHEPLRAAYDPRIAGPVIRVLLRATIARVDRANCRAATRVAVNSRFTAAGVARWYGRTDAQVVYPAVDPTMFHPQTHQARTTLLSVGALHPLKGLDFLVRAVGTLPAAERLPLVIVSDRGRDRDRAALGALARACGVTLVLRPRISEAELVAAYGAARLVLYAPHEEPFGFVPLEAMASARPVLVVAEGGPAETVVDGVTGFVAPRDVRAFGTRLRALLADPIRADAVAIHARAVVTTQWTWTQSVARLDGVLRDAVRPASRAETD